MAFYYYIDKNLDLVFSNLDEILELEWEKLKNSNMVEKTKPSGLGGQTTIRIRGFFTLP
jgi:hypothetical protein